MRIALIIRGIVCTLLGLACSACFFFKKGDNGDEPARRANDCAAFNPSYEWRALDDRNLAFWVPDEPLPYHAQLSRSTPELLTTSQLAFIDGDRDGRLCGAGLDAVIEGSSAARVSIDALAKLNKKGVARVQKEFRMTLKRAPRKKKPTEPSREIAQ